MRAKQGWPFSWNPGGLTAEKREQLDVLPSLLLLAAHPEVSGFPVSWSLGNSGIFNYQPGTPAGGWDQWRPVTPARRWSPREQAQKRLVVERLGEAGQAGPARWREQVVRGPAAPSEPWGSFQSLHQLRPGEVAFPLCASFPLRAWIPTESMELP